MSEATWVPVAVNPLVPAARLGALMVDRRRERKLDLADMANLSNGVFSAAFLERAERGRVALDDDVASRLVGLYELHAGPIVPARNELVLDLNRHEMRVGHTVVGFESLHADDLLEQYVELLYTLRNVGPGHDLVLRDDDLQILAQSLGRSDTEIREQVRRITRAPQSVERAQSVSRRQMIIVGSALVSAIVLGAVVLIATGLGSSTGPAQVLGAQQSVPTSTASDQIAAGAESFIDYDFRGALPGWEILYADDHPDFLGVTRSLDETIVIHVDPNADSDEVAAVLMHEVGHAIDLQYLNDAQRSDWLELRGIPATWWPGNGLSDFAVGAGDFAEAVSAYTTGSASSSVYGDFTAEQLAFVAEILADVEP